MTQPCTHPEDKRFHCGRDFIWCARCGAVRRMQPVFQWQAPELAEPGAVDAPPQKPKASSKCCRK